MATQGTSIFALTGNQAKPLPRCIIPLLDALGWGGDELHLAAALPHMPETMGISDLLNTFANLKFEGKVFPTRLNKIDSRLLPCLFIDGKGRALTVVRKAGKEALVYDGSKGEYLHMKLDGRRGRAVFFKSLRKGADSFLKQQRNWFKKVMGRFSRIFALGAAISLVLTLLALLSPVFIMALYDQALTAGGERTVIYLSAGISLYLLIDLGFKLLRSKVFSFISVRLGNIIGNEVLRRILYLPPAFTETASLGAQVARIRDFETVREFFGGTALISLLELPFLVILLIALTYMGGSIAVVPLVAMGIFIIFGLSVMPAMRAVNKKSAQSGSQRQAFTIETLSNLRAIKYTGSTHMWGQRNKEIVADSAIDTFKTAKLTALINAFSQTLVQSAGLFTMAWGVLKVIDGDLSAGGLMASMILTWRILAPIKSGFGVLTQLGRIQRSVAQVDRLMNMKMESKQETNLTVFAGLKGQITFARTALRYSSNAAPALIGIDLDFQAGETVVVVGHDGAGKTTLLKLILGLYNPQAGRVLLDNINVKQIDPVALRQSIGYSPTGSHFFYGTVSQNLKLSNFDASDDDVQAAIKQAFVKDEIDALPEGLDTRIGDHNISLLSLSFRRRLSFARVFLRKPRIMLFDEPESGLTQPEMMKFMDDIADGNKETTAVIATHNPGFFEIADKVVWLENGRIRMVGTPEKVAQSYLTRAA